MNILFVASEAYPLVKTGGLADVAGALPAALTALGEDARVMLPAYPEVLERATRKGKPVSLGDPLGVGEAHLVPARMPGTGVRAWLVDCPALYEREGGPYLDPDGRDWPDNHLRFALLSRAAAMLCIGGSMIGWRPDVFWTAYELRWPTTTGERRDLNPRPLGPQPSALPTELRPPWNHLALAAS